MNSDDERSESDIMIRGCDKCGVPWVIKTVVSDFFGWFMWGFKYH